MLRTSLQACLALGLLSSFAASQNHKLLPSDPEERAHFGGAVALSGNLVVVGAGSLGVSNNGGAYLFDATTGIQLTKLIPSDLSQYDQLGTRVAIEGTLILVSAPGDDELGTQAGSVYFFDALTYGVIGKFLADDGIPGDRLGFGALDMSGSVAIATSTDDYDITTNTGYAYLFSVPSGNQLHKLFPSDGTDFDKFGNSAAIYGDYAAVGAPWGDGNGPSSGSVYIYDVATGAELRKITAADGELGQSFGHDVDLYGTTLIVGAHGDNSLGWTSGAAYVFDVTTGLQLAKLIADDGEAHDAFGISVTIEGNLALVGASIDDSPGGENQGSAYVIDWTTGEQLHKVTAWDPSTGAVFGLDVSLDGSKFCAGAWNDDQGGLDAGAAYVFDFASPDNAGTGYCFGDGSGSACPCSVVSQSGEGCPNSGGTGAVLASLGSASLSFDTFELQVDGCPGNKPGLVLRGSVTVNGGMGNQVGDGLLCTTGSITRSQIQITANGSTNFDNFHGATFGESSLGLGVSTYYQFWYRDAANVCSGSGFNFTNAWEVVWTP